MKKFLIAATFVAAACVPMAAQRSIVNNPDNKAYFGIRVGGEVVCPGKVSEDNVSLSIFKNGGGVELGGIYNIPVVANFYIEPGLKFYYNTYSYKKDLVEIFDGVDGVSIRKFGMRIPVMAGYHFDFTEDVSLSLFTGPELEIGFSAKEHYKGDNIETSQSVYGDGMNRVDVLWGVGAGISCQHFYFGVSGSLGMVNMMSDSDAKFHENRVTFSLGYNF